MQTTNNELSDEKNELRNLNMAIKAIVLVIILVIVFGMGGSLIAQAVAGSNGYDLQNILSLLSENNSLQLRNVIRYVNLIIHLMSFAIPCLLLAFYLHKKEWASYLSLHKRPKIEIVFICFWLILFSLPFINVIYWLNMQMPLPEWAKTMEVNANEMINALLVMEGPGEFILNLIIIALVPALGEELLFRGVFQKALQKIFDNGQWAVWVTAFLFSAIHMQFEGFFPRFLLGALLGYLFLWTKNLWIPILAHFFFNGIQVAAKYSGSDLINDAGAGEVEDPNFIFGILSLVVTVVLAGYLKSRAQQDVKRINDLES